jgi:hypothetical protein
MNCPQSKLCWIDKIIYTKTKNKQQITNSDINNILE